MSVLTQAQTVDIGHGRGRLAAAAAASVRRVDAQMRRPLDVNSAWRDPVLQTKMYDAWIAYVQGRGPKPNHGRALPASQSIHCRGYALDTDDHALVRTLNEHGWYRTASDEPWHFEYFATQDKHLGQPAGQEEQEELDEMSAEAERQIEFIYKALAGPNNGDDPTSELGWTNVGGGRQTARYGVLPIVIQNQKLIAQQTGMIAGLAKAIEQINGGAPIDLKAIEAAAERGASSALDDLTLVSRPDDK